MAIDFEDGFKKQEIEEVIDEKDIEKLNARDKYVREKTEQFLKKVIKEMELEGFTNINIYSPEFEPEISFDKSPFDSNLDEEIYIEDMKNKIEEKSREITDESLYDKEEELQEKRRNILIYMVKTHLDKNALGYYVTMSSHQIKEVLEEEYDFNVGFFPKIEEELGKLSEEHKKEFKEKFIELVFKGIRKWRKENSAEVAQTLKVEKNFYIKDPRFYQELGDIKESIDAGHLFRNHKIDVIRFMFLERVFTPKELGESLGKMILENEHIPDNVKSVIKTCY